MSNRILLPLAVLVGIIIGAVAFRPLAMVNAQVKPPAAEPAPVKVAPVAKWEYKTIQSVQSKDLNDAAVEGYELVSIAGGANDRGTYWRAVFKRPAKGTPR